ncbi:hypothetical protein ACET3Z_013304 [Daucus carota]
MAGYITAAQYVQELFTRLKGSITAMLATTPTLQSRSGILSNNKLSLYRVVARIKDDTGTTTVTLFNKEAEQLIGVPIQKIITEMGEPSHMDKIPAPVANLIGKLCAFQIKINNYNITHGCEEYTVTRVSECSAAGTKSPNTVDAAQKNKKNRLE